VQVGLYRWRRLTGLNEDLENSLAFAVKVVSRDLPSGVLLQQRVHVQTYLHDSLDNVVFLSRQAEGVGEKRELKQRRNISVGGGGATNQPRCGVVADRLADRGIARYLCISAGCCSW
jgi:hypothetical protein